MKVLGFAFTKMNAERKKGFNFNCTKNMNIDFLDITKESIEMLKNEPIYNIFFKYSVSYVDSSTKKENIQAEILLEGIITVSLEKEEDKEFSKTYKKKEMKDELKEGVFNFLLRKCTPRAIDMEDQINLPSHIPLPQVKFNKESKSN